MCRRDQGGVLPAAGEGGAGADGARHDHPLLLAHALRRMLAVQQLEKMGYDLRCVLSLRCIAHRGA